MTGPINPPNAPWLPPAADVIHTAILTPDRSGMPAVGIAGIARTYEILRTVETDAYDAPLDAANIPPPGAPALAPLSDNFSGTARKTAKLSISSAAVETFHDVTALIATLPSLGTMTSLQPPITTGAGSGRTPKEERNIKVKAFLYAASRENDNDFHLIVGVDPTQNPTYMTMEISGLPPNASASFARLKAARDAYSTFFNGHLPASGYDFYNPPIPVEIEGSLFFDMTHATGQHPGPQRYQASMPVIWEVHPVTNIVFEP